MCYRLLVLVALLALASLASAADVFVIEDWSKQPLNTRGIPQDWKGQNWGNPTYDMRVVEEDGRRVLHLLSKNEGSTVTKDLKGKINLKETPILEWTWKAVVLPQGGDSRHKDTDDQAAQIYVTFPRFPEAVRSRIIGYVWDTTAPAGTIIKSGKTSTITYVVVRSGPADLGKWITEKRNVLDDFKTLYREEPDQLGGISVGIDSNDTRSSAESYLGAIIFRKP